MSSVFKSMLVMSSLVAWFEVRAFDQYFKDPRRSSEFKLVAAVVSQNVQEIERLILAGADPSKQPQEGGSSAEKLAERPPFQKMREVIDQARRKRGLAPREAAETKEP